MQRIGREFVAGITVVPVPHRQHNPVLNDELKVVMDADHWNIPSDEVLQLFVERFKDEVTLHQMKSLAARLRNKAPANEKTSKAKYLETIPKKLDAELSTTMKAAGWVMPSRDELERLYAPFAGEVSFERFEVRAKSLNKHAPSKERKGYAKRKIPLPAAYVKDADEALVKHNQGGGRPEMPSLYTRDSLVRKHGLDATAKEQTVSYLRKGLKRMQREYDNPGLVIKRQKRARP